MSILVFTAKERYGEDLIAMLKKYTWPELFILACMLDAQEAEWSKKRRTVFGFIFY